MRGITKIVAEAYDYNTYNLDCRSSEISELDANFIKVAYEVLNDCRMVYPCDAIGTTYTLDLGCGNGFPYTKELAKYSKVVGCDASARQIACARLNVPSGVFIKKDMLDLRLRHKYHVVVMFNSFFNIHDDDKYTMLRKIYNWLEPYGVVIVTTYGEFTEVKSKEFHGMPMVWYHLSPYDFEKLVNEAGFVVIGHDSRNDNCGSQDTHLWLLEKSH